MGRMETIQNSFKKIDSISSAMHKLFVTEEKKSVKNELDQLGERRRIKTDSTRQDARVTLSHIKHKRSAYLKERMEIEEVCDRRLFTPTDSLLEFSEENDKREKNPALQIKKWYSTAKINK